MLSISVSLRIGPSIMTQSDNQPYILYEHEVNASIHRLDAAWENPSTFAFLADKSGTPLEWVEESLEKLPPEFRNDHFILFTSGSTGAPRMVIGDRRRAERLAVLLHDLHEAEPVRETLVALPLTYCYAFVNQYLWARQCGRRLVLTDGFARPDAFQTALEEARDAMLCLVGAQVPFLMQFFAGKTFPGLIRLHFAGGRFPQASLPFLQSLFPSATIFNNYGCAEAMPRLTLRRSEVSTLAHHIGWPLPGVEIKADEAGRMFFRSPYGAVALADESGFTRIDATTWVPTGDMGRVEEDGHWQLTGREGEVFKRYGEKVSAAHLLNELREIWPGQADFFREQDSRGEEGFVLLLAPTPGEEQVKQILKHLRMRYSRPHWPLRIESTDALPLLPNGKIDRQALSQLTDTVVQWRQRI